MINLKGKIINVYLVLLLPLVLLVAMSVLGWLVSSTAPVDAQGSTVTVTAAVATSVTCANNIASTDLGTLSSASVSTSTDASSSMSCNVGTGCTLTIADAGNAVNPGLSTTTPAYLIPSPNAAFNGTTTIVAGTEGFGVNATSSAGGTGTLNMGYRYARKLSDSPIVGGLTIAGITLASSSAAVNNVQLLVRHVAAISGTTQAGKYVDTITYSCASN